MNPEQEIEMQRATRKGAVLADAPDDRVENDPSHRARADRGRASERNEVDL